MQPGTRWNQHRKQSNLTERITSSKKKNKNCRAPLSTSTFSVHHPSFCFHTRWIEFGSSTLENSKLKHPKNQTISQTSMSSKSALGISRSSTSITEKNVLHSSVRGNTLKTAIAWSRTSISTWILSCSKIPKQLKRYPRWKSMAVCHTLTCSWTLRFTQTCCSSELVSRHQN